jgi:hypothetical protein
MRGNPAWNEGRNIRRGGEMLGTKNGQGNRKKQSAKWHDLVHAMFLRQFPENFDEADAEKQRRTNIDPECHRRHAKRRGSQSRYDDNELLETAHDDLQRGALPGDFEWRHSKAANQGKQPDCDQCTRFTHEMLATDGNPAEVLSQRM